MLSPELLNLADAVPDPIALANAGGWAVVVAMVVALGIGFVRGDIIPGHIYRREVKRADTATIQAERNATAIRELTRELRKRKPDAPPG